ncbi:protein O-GlcNAcase-like [Montipora foliosa]|uniref:protein O-GlcNAcase-like n=1 Tax=Montipora foliosa TaxID=591990 RepID=UPI0035F15298
MKALSGRVRVLKNSKLKLRSGSKKRITMSSDVPKPKSEEFICGVVEGFYGRPWTYEQRKELFLRLKNLGMNTYLYAPKDDLKHRALWRDLYSPEETENLKQLITSSKECGVTFYYALSPGLDILFSSTRDIQQLKRKMGQVQKLGCEAFALLFDDIDPQLHGADVEAFRSFGQAQVEITNVIYKYLGCSHFLFCPTEYCGTRAVPNVETSDYLNTLGTKLDPKINIMWTGPKVISKVISTQTIEALTNVLKRKPVIWDNIHANDYDQRRVFLGPYDGRPVELFPMLNGVLTNPNCEFESNFIAIHTLASWSRDASLVTVEEPMSIDPKASSSAEPMEEDLLASTESNESESVHGKTEEEVSQDNVGGGISDTETVKVEGEMDTESGASLIESKSTVAHSVYDPQNALQEAVTAWLEEFSKVKNATSRTYAKSGAYCVTPEAMPVQVQASVAACTRATTTSATTTVCSPVVTPSPIKVAKDNSRKKLSSSVSPEKKDQETVTKEQEMPMEIIELKEKPASTPLNADDLLLLVDLFYLPYNHGQKAKQIISDFKWLKFNAIKEDSQEFMELTEQEQKTKVTEWTEKAEKFHEICRSVEEMFVRLTETSNRALLYDLYPYVWDVKEVLLLLDTFVNWLSTKNKRKKQKGQSFFPEDPEPWVFRGGLCGELQRLLPIDGGHEVFNLRAPDIPTTCIYTIRPYQLEDEKSLYEICVSTCDDWQDGHDLFPCRRFNMAGDRFVGPYLKICPEHVFVVEDGEGLCGFAVATSDSKHFYEQFKKHWLPEVCKKYGLPEGNSSEWTYAEQLASGFHNPSIFLPQDLHTKYSAHVQIYLLPRAQDLGLGKRLLACVLSALKAEDCTGVHCEIATTNSDALDFYTKLGFYKIPLKDQAPPDTVIFGRTF